MFVLSYDIIFQHPVEISLDYRLHQSLKAHISVSSTSTYFFFGFDWNI